MNEHYKHFPRVRKRSSRIDTDTSCLSLSLSLSLFSYRTYSSKRAESCIPCATGSYSTKEGSATCTTNTCAVDSTMTSEANEEQVRLWRFTVTVQGGGAAHVCGACGVRVKGCVPMVTV